MAGGCTKPQEVGEGVEGERRGDWFRIGGVRREGEELEGSVDAHFGLMAWVGRMMSNR